MQQLVRNALLAIGKLWGLEDDDIKSTSMGVSGVDVQFSPLAKRLLGNMAIECKKVEKLNVVGVFKEHAAKYPTDVPILVHSRNHVGPMVTMSFAFFLVLLGHSIAYRQLLSKNES